MSTSDREHEDSKAALDEVREAVFDLSNVIGTLRDPQQVLAAARFLGSAVVAKAMESNIPADAGVIERQDAIQKALRRGARQLAEHVRSRIRVEKSHGRCTPARKKKKFHFDLHEYDSAPDWKSEIAELVSAEASCSND